MDQSERFLGELRTEVLAAAAPRAVQGRAGPPRWLLAATVIAVAAFSAALVIARSDEAAAHVEVVRVQEHFVVTLTDLEADADEVEAAAQAAGLELSVDEVPVGPSNVGRFISADASELPEGLEVTRGDPKAAFTEVKIPVAFDGKIRLQLGRPAKEGEAWAILSDAAAPGEVLECLDLTGLRLSEAAERATSAGVSPRRILRIDQGRLLDPSEWKESGDLTVVRSASSGTGELYLQVAAIPPSRPTAREGC